MCYDYSLVLLEVAFNSVVDKDLWSEDKDKDCKLVKDLWSEDKDKDCKLVKDLWSEDKDTVV